MSDAKPDIGDELPFAKPANPDRPEPQRPTPFCRVADLFEFSDHCARTLSAPSHQSMNLNAHTATLKIKLSETLLLRFKERVAAQNISRNGYVAQTLHYGLQENGGLDDLQPSASTEAPDVYLSAQVPMGLRNSLLQHSDRLGYNAASFCGLLLARHFERHPRDPRELPVLYPIDLTLSDNGELDEDELQAILERHGAKLLAGVSPVFMANWFFNRFRSRIKRIKSRDAEVSFSANYMKELLGKLTKRG
jgi:hypothetical protein